MKCKIDGDMFCRFMIAHYSVQFYKLGVSLIEEMGGAVFFLISNTGKLFQNLFNNFF